MKRVLYILIFSLAVLGLNCQSKQSKDSASDSVVGDLKYYRIVVNNAPFDSIGLHYRSDSELQIEDNGNLIFVTHRFDGVYYNFMGLINKENRKWIVYNIDTTKECNGNVIMNPEFSGFSPDTKYVLFKGGSSGGSTVCEIYNLKGTLVFSCVAMEVGMKYGWEGNSDFAFWSFADSSMIDTARMKKVDPMNSWVQKCIWTSSGLIKTDSIIEKYTE